MQLPLFLWVKKRKNFPVKAITPFMYLVFFSAIYDLVFTHFLKVPSTIWFYVYLLLEYGAITYFYYFILPKSQHKIIQGFTVIFLILFVGFLFIFNLQNSFRLESYLSLVETTAVWVFSYLWIKNLFQDFEREKSILNYPTFYFIMGFVIYLSGTIILFLLIHYIEKKDGISRNSLWNLNLFFLLVFRLINYKAIWMGRMKK
jgi:hypothetical protein